jgi:hypothetical protein
MKMKNENAFRCWETRGERIRNAGQSPLRPSTPITPLGHYGRVLGCAGCAVMILNISIVGSSFVEH